MRHASEFNADLSFAKYLHVQVVRYVEKNENGESLKPKHRKLLTPDNSVTWSSNCRIDRNLSLVCQSAHQDFCYLGNPFGVLIENPKVCVSSIYQTHLWYTIPHTNHAHTSSIPTNYSGKSVCFRHVDD